MKKRIALLTLTLLQICSTALAYIGNRNSGKFHYDHCYWVSKMAPYNKVYIESREEAIQQGYALCKVCRP